MLNSKWKLIFQNDPIFTTIPVWKTVSIHIDEIWWQHLMHICLYTEMDTEALLSSGDLIWCGTWASSY